VSASTEPRRPLVRSTLVALGRFHAFDLARELNTMGALERLVTGHPTFHAATFGVPRSRVVGMPVFLAASKLVGRSPPQLRQRGIEALDRAFSEAARWFLGAPNIVHAFAGYALPSLRWARHRGAMSIVERSSSHIVYQQRLLSEEFARFSRAIPTNSRENVERELLEYASADAIAVPSSFVKRSFLAQGVPEERLLLAPFGTNLNGFAPGPGGDGRFRVVYGGTVNIRKGVHYLVRAFNAAGIPRSELVLVGTLSNEAELVLAEARDNVRTVGHVPQAELVQHYRNATVFVMPSLEEGLAVVQAQALATGLPLICTTNTGGEDLLRLGGAMLRRIDGRIDEYPAGYVVPIRDPDAIATCLRLLANDPQLVGEKRAAALDLRGSGLGWSDYARRVLDSYESLLARRRA
jgi:alpha-maltose-1-phosphate synthase